MYSKSLRILIILPFILCLLHAKTCINIDKTHDIYVHIGQVQDTYILSIEISLIISVFIGITIFYIVVFEIDTNPLFIDIVDDGRDHILEKFYNYGMIFLILGTCLFVDLVLIKFALHKC